MNPDSHGKSFAVLAGTTAMSNGNPVLDTMVVLFRLAYFELFKFMIFLILC